MLVALPSGGGSSVLDGGRAASRGAESTPDASATSRTEAISKAMATAVGVAAGTKTQPQPGSSEQSPYFGA